MSCHTCGEQAKLICRECNTFEFCSEECSNERSNLHYSLCEQLVEASVDRLPMEGAKQRAAEFRKQAAKMAPEDPFAKSLMVVSQEIDAKLEEQRGASHVEAPSIAHVYKNTYVDAGYNPKRQVKARRGKTSRDDVEVTLKDANSIIATLEASYKRMKGLNVGRKGQLQATITDMKQRVAIAVSDRRKKVYFPKKYVALKGLRDGIISLEYEPQLFLPVIGEALEMCADAYPEDERIQELLAEHAEHIEGGTDENESGAWAEVASNYIIEQVEGAPYRALLNVQLLTAKGRAYIINKVIPKAKASKLRDIRAKASQLNARVKIVKNQGSPTYQDVINAVDQRL